MDIARLVDKANFKIFMSKFDWFGDCMNWTGTMHKTGYGMYNGCLAHRFSWYLQNGNIPTNLQTNCPDTNLKG